MKGLRRNATPEEFAKAMSKCQHPFALCAQDFYCHYGDCDQKAKKSAEERLDKLESQIKKLTTTIQRIKHAKR